MNLRFFNVLASTVGFCGLAVVASAQSGGDFSLTWSTVHGGGAASGGGFTLNGTVGQPNAGPSLSGGGFAISGGFWAGVSEAAPRIAIRLAGANTVILSWPNPSTGYVLQETSDLSAPGGGWSDVAQSPVVVGANKEVTLPATGHSRLFRLRRP